MLAATFPHFGYNYNLRFFTVISTLFEIITIGKKEKKWRPFTIPKWVYNLKSVKNYGSYATYKRCRAKKNTLYM